MAPLREFLAGAHAMDKHFATAPLEKNLPVLLGLLGLYNSTFLGYNCKAILPYAQALLRFAAHIQQVDMESNGKRVAMDGSALPFEAGEIVFGEPGFAARAETGGPLREDRRDSRDGSFVAFPTTPVCRRCQRRARVGTNGQHSFYQLMHQGRVVPAEFIGFKTSQAPVTLAGAALSNHDELMCNFFAQPDALALGKESDDPHKFFPGAGRRPTSFRADAPPPCRATAADVETDGAAAARSFRCVPDDFAAEPAADPLGYPPPPRVSSAASPRSPRDGAGDRPSLSLLFDAVTPRSMGLLLALYEHRVAVQGWVWGINSFDQWGVQLGKVLAKEVGKALEAKSSEGFNSSTAALLDAYMK